MDSFKCHDEREQRQILDDLAADSKEKGELEELLERVDDAPAAVDLIQFMMSEEDAADGAPMKLIKAILNRPSVRRTGEVFPRTNSFADAGERNQSNAIRILNALVNKCTKLLLPKDDANGRALLINAMIKSATFRKYSVPSRRTDAEMKYKQFASLPTVQAVELAIKALGQSDEGLRTQLLSLLDNYPRRWVKKLTGVGTKTLKKAKWHAAVVGPGLSDKMAPALRRDRRSGPVENHFEAWLKEATIVLPNVNKDNNGQYKSEPIIYLRQNRHQAIKSYQKDFSLAKSDGRFDLNGGHSAYGLMHLYQRFKEENLREAPEEHAVCSHCHKNNSNWKTWTRRSLAPTSTCTKVKAFVSSLHLQVPPANLGQRLVWLQLQCLRPSHLPSRILKSKRAVDSLKSRLETMDHQMTRRATMLARLSLAM